MQRKESGERGVIFEESWYPHTQKQRIKEKKLLVWMM
jgi:hypothetical protein